MTTLPSATDTRVAVLVDCDNVSPESLEFALKVVAQFGRVVLRRGYGNHGTLANKWQHVLVSLAFTPCLQYQFAPGKNTADIALALDAMEALFDKRADTFCLVTSDSDFAHLCRKLRERGATVYIVGETKTPDALRNASDQFFEWTKVEPLGEVTEKPAYTSEVVAKLPGPPDFAKPVPKRRPRFLIDAVALLAADTSEGKVGLGALGQYLKRTEPGVFPQRIRTFGTLGHGQDLRLAGIDTGAGRPLVGRPCARRCSAQCSRSSMNLLHYRFGPLRIHTRQEAQTKPADIRHIFARHDGIGCSPKLISYGGNLPDKRQPSNKPQ